MLESRRVSEGYVALLRLYEVANEIDLGRASASLAATEVGSVERAKLAGTAPKAVQFDVPPLVVEVGEVELSAGDSTYRLQARSRVYDFGVISVALRLPVADRSWAEFTELVNALAVAADAPGAAGQWEGVRDRVLDLIRDSLIKPTADPLEEDYMLAVVSRFDAAVGAKELLDDARLIPVLSSEARPLSDDARDQLLRNSFSYYPDDLVVVTWDRALIVDTTADSAEVIEMANAQLLEMRYYNDLLDGEMPRMYDRVELTRGAIGRLSRRGYAGLARDLHKLVAEVTELKEKVENALEVTRDVHLARIYGRALNVFGVPLVSAAVDRKLAIIRDTYTALYNDALNSRTELLEVAIVLLILVDIIIALAFG